jgi:hypothetical protein
LTHPLPDPITDTINHEHVKVRVGPLSFERLQAAFEITPAVDRGDNDRK